MMQKSTSQNSASIRYSKRKKGVHQPTENNGDEGNKDEPPGSSDFGKSTQHSGFSFSAWWAEKLNTDMVLGAGILALAMMVWPGFFGINDEGGRCNCDCNQSIALDEDQLKRDSMRKPVLSSSENVDGQSCSSNGEISSNAENVGSTLNDGNAPNNKILSNEDIKSNQSER